MPYFRARSFCTTLILPVLRSASGTFLRLSSPIHTFPPLLNPNPSFETKQNPRTPLQQLLLHKSKSGFDKLEDALLLFDKMLQMRPLLPVHQFTQLLTALVKMEEYGVAVSLFRDMCVFNIPVNIYTFSIVINCFCHLRRLDFAFSMLGGIIKRGFVPNVVTFTTLIRGLITEHKLVESEDLLIKLIRLDEIEPNLFTHNTIINGLCKQLDTSGALSWLRFMEKEGCQPDAVTYSTVLDSLCKQGLVDDALHLHSDMIMKSISPNVVTYSSLIDGLLNSSRWEKANLIFQEMIDVTNISPNAHTFSILVNAYHKNGKVRDAERVVEIMIKRGLCPDTFTYNTHACILFKKKNGWSVSPAQYHDQ